MEFFSDLLKMKEDRKLSKASKLSKVANLSSNVEIVVDKEEATTPNKKHAKPPKATHNATTVAKKTISTCSSQAKEVPIKKNVSIRSSSRCYVCFETFWT